jgi:hypothetical protein
MPDCVICKLPVKAEHCTNSKGEPQHWTLYYCIDALVSDTTRLRQQLADGVALSGVVARLEKWLAADHVTREAKIEAKHIGKGFWVYLAGSGTDGYGNPGATFADALTPALDAAEGV